MKKAGQSVADLDDEDLRTIGFEREEAERAEQDAVVENLYNFKGILRFNPCGLSDQLIVYFNFAKKG